MRFPLATPNVRVPRTGVLSYGAPRGRRDHEGVDLVAPLGEPVEAPETCRVIRTLDNPRERCGFGIVMRGPSGIWTMCHFAAMALFERGETVQEGTIVGHVGQTGDATGPHLHIALRDAQGRAIDPTEMLADALAAERITSHSSEVSVRRRASEESTSFMTWLLAGLVVFAVVSSSDR